MVKCTDVIHFLDTYLAVSAITDSSRNGLQVSGKEEVTKIVFGVSASLELFKQAQYAGADLIVVHHGLLWGKEQTVTGLFRERLSLLLANNIGLAGYHLPLDKHPVVGNNACLMRAINAQSPQPFGEYHGNLIGFAGHLPNQPLAEVVAKLEAFCQTKATVLAYGPEKVKSVGVISGGAHSMLPQALDQHLDLFVTGALDEPVQEWCREGYINCVALGHYNSEKCGVLALKELVAKNFDVQTEFIDVSNPL